MKSPKSTAAIIDIPYGTRLASVVLVRGEVHVWIALKSKGPEYNKWQGTYLRIEESGRVTRVTQDDNYTTDDEFLIKP